jgi:uncharacterized protein (TIGR00251 family)
VTDGRSSVAVDADPEGIGFFIHVSPGARRDEIGPAHGDALRVRTSAPPVEGRANAACREALARAFGVAVADVRIDPASRGRRKRLFVAGDPVALSARLHLLATRSGLG